MAIAHINSASNSDGGSTTTTAAVDMTGADLFVVWAFNGTVVFGEAI